MTQGKVVFLQQGDRLYFEKDWACGVIESGCAEVYAAVTDDSERMFLLQRGENEYFFSAVDEFKTVELYIFAKTDISVRLFTRKEAMFLAETDGSGIKNGMSGWFTALLALPWLRFFAVRGDDFIGQWRKKEFLSGIDKKLLWQEFLQHQEIFTFLLCGQFNSLQKYFSERLNKRREKKKQLMGAALGRLLGRDDLSFLLDSTQGKSNDNAVFVVRRVAEFFHMDVSQFVLPSDIIKQLKGINLLKRLAGKGGIQLRKVKLSDGWYKKDCGVLLVERKGVWAAAIPSEPGKYNLYTEKFPEGETVDSLVAEELSGEAYVCYAGFPKRKLTVKDLMRFMYQQCWKVDCKYIILASFIAGLIPLLMPIITKSIFSDIIPIGDRQGLATITQVMMVAGFTGAAVSLVRSIAVLRITNHLDMAVEAALWSRLLSLPAGFFKKYQTGELVQRMSGIDVIKELLTGEFVSSVFNTVFSFWSILLMCYYSLRLTLVALVVWIIYLIITAFIYRRVHVFNKNAITAANKTSGQVLQIFNGLAKFRSQGAEEQAFYLWSKCFGEEWHWNLKMRWQNNYSTIINSVQPLILNLLLYYSAVYGMGGQNMAGIQSSISYSDFIGFQAAFSSFNVTLVNMIPLGIKFFSVRPYIENLRPILETEPETADDKIEAGCLSGEIEMRHLSFAYSEDGPDVLKDINLSISPGESIAIVGRSGCGKSTLIRLLLGFEKPKRGAVYYDGIDLEELSVTSVRSQMGVVMQNGQLMAGDIFTNIVGTNPLTMEDAWKAARRVGLDKDIKAMPMQMYTAISEGSGNISGGQRQRILLARSIVNNPHILLLDEATSALDNTTQAIVTKSLEEMACTRIIVAHRLSTIKNVDRIIVMDEGVIAEEGTYDELMEKNGIFTQLARRQLV